MGSDQQWFMRMGLACASFGRPYARFNLYHDLVPVQWFATWFPAGIRLAALLSLTYGLYARSSRLAIRRAPGLPPRSTGTGHQLAWF